MCCTRRVLLSAWSRHNHVHTVFTLCRVVRGVFVPQGAEYIFPVKAKGTHLLVCVGAMENASSKRHSLRSENDAKQGNGRRKASGSASPGGYSNHTWMSVQSLCVLNGLPGTLLLVVVCVATLTGVWCLVAVGTCPTQLRRHTLRRASSCTPTCACPATTCASARSKPCSLAQLSSSACQVRGAERVEPLQLLATHL